MSYNVSMINKEKGADKMTKKEMRSKLETALALLDEVEESMMEKKMRREIEPVIMAVSYTRDSIRAIK